MRRSLLRPFKWRLLVFIICCFFVTYLTFHRATRIPCTSRGQGVPKCVSHPQLDLSVPPFAPLTTCPRFLVQHHHPDAGIGHMFGGIVFASKLALELDAAVVLDDGYWTAQHAKHGGFPYFRRLMNLYAFMSVSELESLNITLSSHHMSSRSEVYDFWGEPVQDKHCNVRIDIDTSFGTFCEGGWCFQRWPGVYNHMQPYFQKLYRHDIALSLVRSYYNKINNNLVRNVVWHVRASDISLHANDSNFFKNVFMHLNASANVANVKLQHYIFSGDKNAPNALTTDKPPNSFEFLKDVVPGAMFVSSSFPEVDLLHMCQADVLIGTGSSFAHTAAMLAPPQLIYVEHPPKEDRAVGSPTWNTYHLQSSIVVNYDGEIDQCNTNRLVLRLTDPNKATYECKL